MEAHEHQQSPNANNQSFFKRHRWLTIIGLLILLYFLLVEHRQHVWPYLPFLLLLACPLMHLFMHGGHHQHPRDKKKGSSQ